MAVALLWLGFKWSPQHIVDNLPTWAEGKGGQQAVANTGSSAEAFIRNRGFPTTLSNSFGQILNASRSNLLVHLRALRTLGFGTESFFPPFPPLSLAI